MQRLLSALTFPAFILAALLLYQSRQTQSQSTAILYYLTAAASLALALAGLRAKHQKPPPS